MSSLADQTRFLDAMAHAQLVRSGEVSASELVDAAIERIEALDGPINAVNYRWFDDARALAAGDLPDGPFRGVPFLLKDLFAPYQGKPMSNGNRPTKERGELAAFDSTLVARHRAAGLTVRPRVIRPAARWRATSVESNAATSPRSLVGRLPFDIGLPW